MAVERRRRADTGIPEPFGRTLVAQTGATPPDQMKRLGHSTTAAARRYRHAVDGRDRKIAETMSELAAHGDAARLPRQLGTGGESHGWALRSCDLRRCTD
jgi:hypothetical protein